MERKDNRGRALKRGEYQRSNGSYEYRYSDPLTGTTRSTCAQTLIELRKKEEALRSDVRAGVVRKGSTMTLNDAFDDWVVKRRKEVEAGLLRQHTLDNYVYLWNLEFRKSRLGKCKVSCLTRELIQDHYRDMLARGRTIGTVETFHSPLSQVVKYAWSKGWCKSDVSAGACTEISKAARKRDEAEGKMDHPKCLEASEREALLKELSDPRWRHYAPIVRLLLHTGMRISELCGLTDEDVSDESIWIRRSLGYKHDEYGHLHFVAGPPKTPKSRREVLLTDAAKRDIDDWKAAGATCKAKPCGLSGLVFCKPRGGALNYAAVNKVLHDLARVANRKVGHTVIPDELTCHWLRHTFITDAIDAGVPPHVVARYVGHEQVDVTMRVYYTCRRKSVEEAVDILNRAERAANDSGLVLVEGNGGEHANTKINTKNAS